MESEVKLSSGQVATKKENVKVRELAAAGNQPKGKEYLIPYATVAAKILIDGKAVVLEDVLDMTEDDFVLVSNLFIDEDDLKKRIIPIEDVVFLSHFTGSGLNEILDLEIDFFEISLQSAFELYRLEQESIKRVLVVGFEKGEN